MISAIAATAAAAWATITAASAAAAATTTSASTVSAPTAAMRPASATAPWTIGPIRACVHRLAIGIFTVEVGFLVFAEIASTFKGDSFFATTRLRRGSFTTVISGRRSGCSFTSFTTLSCQLGALLFQDGLARQLDAVAFDGQDFHQHLIAFL